MSRVANSPIQIPNGVTVNIANKVINVKGPKGELSHTLHDFVNIEQVDDTLQIKYDTSIADKQSGSKNSLKINIVALAGTNRALVNNVIQGVANGFEKKLTMVGVGYRAQVQGNKLNISAGFSHPVLYELPEGITVETPSQTEIVVKGVDKQRVGQVAAEIRAVRPPEPYKGKGIRYADERVVIKETKKK
jgi:large subunit ribosomal protein L6